MTPRIDPNSFLPGMRNLAKFEEDGDYLIIKEKMPTQVMSEKDKENLESAASTVESTFVLGFILSITLAIVLKNVMSQLWNTFNTLQIIIAVTTIPVALPANIKIVTEVLDQVINFKPVEPKQVQELFMEGLLTLGSDEESAEPTLFAKSFLIIGIMFIGALLITFIILFQKLCLNKCCGCCQKIFRWIKSKLMFSILLRACMQTFLYTSISMWKSLLDSNTSSTNGIIDLAVCLVMFAYLLAFTIFSFVFLRKNFEDMPDPAFKTRYDAMYQNVDYFKKKAVINTTMFAIRRLLFAFVIVFCYQSIVLQVFLCDILSTILLGFYSSVQPMTDNFNNRLQIYNEIVVLVCIWLLFHWTQFVESPQ